MCGRRVEWLFDIGLEESVCTGSPEREEEVPNRKGNEVPRESPCLKMTKVSIVTIPAAVRAQSMNLRNTQATLSS